MSEAPLAALYRTMNLRWSTANELWGARAYAERAPAKVTRPYVIYQWQGGGDRNRLMQKKDAEIVLTVKCVADNLGTAFTGADRLGALLDDYGVQDRIAQGDGLNGGDYWSILTTTRENIVHLSEMVDGVDVYHEGFTLRVVMEEK